MTEANWMRARKCTASLSRRMLAEAQRFRRKRVLHLVALTIELLVEPALLAPVRLAGETMRGSKLLKLRLAVSAALRLVPASGLTL